MEKQKLYKEHIVIKFAGDSGDGMQLTGNQFSMSTALRGHDIATFPDFPAEIRAPLGTVAGVSGFQIHFGSIEIDTPGDQCDVLVAMNAAALKSNLANLKQGGIIIADEDGFDKKNLKLSGYDENDNPLDVATGKGYQVFKVAVTKLTLESLSSVDMSAKDKDRSKNMFVLGLLYWLFDRDLQPSLNFLEQRFAKDDLLRNANTLALKAGYHFGETTEIFPNNYELKAASLPEGNYRSITGNEALALGMIMATYNAGLHLFYGTYPITPASDILHFLAKQKQYGVYTFQAEDEIAAVSAAIGASFGGNLGACGTSGPGMALKAEAIGLAVAVELPLVICNVQRSGPSTGMPTKTEQSDLFQALYGRNGEAPVPIIAPQSPVDCFYAAYEACKIAMEHMTPVIILSDAYLANGAEPWKYPQFEELEKITPPFASPGESKFQPYVRDNMQVRPWAVPGTAGLEHRIGGLEKEHISGNVSYNGENHDFMVKLRQEKIDLIAKTYAPQRIALGEEKGKLLILGWGSTYGFVKTVVKELLEEGYAVSQLHLRYINPLPENLGEILKGFEKIVVPEMNNGQLVHLIRSKYLVDAIPYNKIKGQPLHNDELKQELLKHLNA